MSVKKITIKDNTIKFDSIYLSKVYFNKTTYLQFLDGNGLLLATVKHNNLTVENNCPNIKAKKIMSFLKNHILYNIALGDNYFLRYVSIKKPCGLYSFTNNKQI